MSTCCDKTEMFKRLRRFDTATRCSLKSIRSKHKNVSNPDIIINIAPLGKPYIMYFNKFNSVLRDSAELASLRDKLLICINLINLINGCVECKKSLKYLMLYYCMHKVRCMLNDDKITPAIDDKAIILQSIASTENQIKNLCDDNIEKFQEFHYTQIEEYSSNDSARSFKELRHAEHLIVRNYKQSSALCTHHFYIFK
jgi:hypothetical protein